MGCAPSITVSQSGVVYCRDSDESNSPKPSFSQQQIVHIRTSNTAELSETGLSATGTVTVFHKKDRRGTISIEAETQTSKSTVTMKGMANEVSFGPMRVCQRTMQVMLVFSKEDAQSDGFWWAADKGGYKCNIVRNPTDALECFVEKQHDVIIIDHRHSKNFDAVGLCRSIRATKLSDYNVIVAVTRKSSADKDEASVIPLLNAGFSRRIVENPNTAACLNELLQLEYVDVRSQLKLRAANALFGALEACADSIEITSENRIVQYVNSAYEQLTGYSSEDILGREMDDIPRCDKNKPEVMDTIYSQLKKAKPWEGLLFSKKKNGESMPQLVHISPITGHGGRVRHHVYNIKNPVGIVNQSVFSQELQHIDKITSDISNGTSIRRQSMARIHSMTIEAPITKVINIISAAQENSPVTVVQALDRVLEILHSSELYNPQLSTLEVKEEDQMTTDLVGGLMKHGGYSARRRMSGSEAPLSKTNSSSHHSPTPSHMNQAPVEVQKMLERDAMWDFNIMELERITQHRPLIYLGLKVFNRFQVGSFLGISETVLRNWLQVIEANYHSSNPYHNSTHAADVMQATGYFIGKEKLKTCFEPADEVASLIAATVHDIDHPGRTNSFLCNAASDLAILYNDVAVLESHHAALAFQLTTREDRCNIFKELDREDYRAMRHTIIDMILATEMTKHFEHLSKFINCINKPVLRDGEDSLSMPSTGRSTPDSASLTNPENRALIRRMLIKCADVSNPTRPLEMCMVWARRISEEYFAQTDEEKKRGLQVVMPVFDRTTCSIPKSQISFTEYFIMDMFDAWDAFIDCQEVMEHLRNNYKYWTTKEEEERRKKEERELEK